MMRVVLVAFAVAILASACGDRTVPASGSGAAQSASPAAGTPTPTPAGTYKDPYGY
jgi:hypothetical protein